MAESNAGVPTACHACGATFLHAAAALPGAMETPAIAAPGAGLCPYCRALEKDRQQTLAWRLRVAAGMAGVVVVTGWWLHPREVPTPLYFIFWWMIAFGLLEPALTLLQAMAHVLAARIMGMRVFGGVWGAGRVKGIWGGRWFLLQVSARWRYWRCVVETTGRSAARWRRALLIALGPAIQLALAATAFGKLLGPWEEEAYHDPRHGLWVGLLMVSGWGFFRDVRPRQVQTASGLWRSTGEALRHLLNHRETSAEMLGRHVHDAWLFAARGEWQRAEALAGQLQAMDAENVPPVWPLLVRREGWARVAVLAREGMTSARNQHVVGMCRAWAAVADVYSGADLERADEMSTAAMAEHPNALATRAVRAVVLLAMGQTEPAARLLVSPEVSVQAFTSAGPAAAWAWAEIYWRREQRSRARRMERWARRLDTDALYRLPERHAAAVQAAAAAP